MAKTDLSGSIYYLINMENGLTENPANSHLYCPKCSRAVADPLVCGDCMAVICRACGTPLENTDELATG